VALANNCISQATTSGTGTFSISGTPITGFYPPLLAGAIKGSSYSYKAQSADLSQWEVGIGTYSTQINPSFESVDNTQSGGFWGTSPKVLNAPPTVNNGDLVAAYIGLSVAPGTSPGVLGIAGGGGTWNVQGPAGPYRKGDGSDAFVWLIWKIAASEPSSYTFTWTNSDGNFSFWLAASFKTGGSTPALDNYNGAIVTSNSNSVQAQSSLAGGIELRLMAQFNWAGLATSTPQSKDFISITPYTGNQPAFGYAMLNNVSSAPAIPNNAGSYTGFSGGAVFSFSGSPDTLSRDFVLESSNFNQLVNFVAPPKILLSAAAHEISGQLPIVVTATAYTITDTDAYLIYNGAAPTVFTLPAASSWFGRQIAIRNLTTFNVASSTSNILPVDSSTLTNAILPATAGTWLILKSNGTSWETEQTNIGTYGTPLASAVFAWPVTLPFNDLTLTAFPLFTTFVNPFTATINIGSTPSPFMVVLLPPGGSADTVTIGGVTIPFVAAGSRGAVFAGRATGLSGSQTLSINSSNWAETVIGVWQSQFSWIVQSAVGAQSSTNGNISVAASSVLLGCIDADGSYGGTPPGTIDLTGSTASPTARQDASYDSTGTGNFGLQTTSASWNIAAAGTFHLTYASAGMSNQNYLLCDLTLAPASPLFRKLVAADVPLIQYTPVATAALPSAASAGDGARVFVTDAITPAFGVALTGGGGGVPSPVYSDGTIWRTG